MQKLLPEKIKNQSLVSFEDNFDNSAEKIIFFWCFSLKMLSININLSFREMLCLKSSKMILKT